MRVMKWSMIALAVAAGTSQLAVASSQDEAKGFVEDSTLNLKTRAMYMNRDFKHGAGNRVNPDKSSGFENGYNEDSGVSLLGVFESGFTQGTVGVGVDVLGMGAVRIDGGGGRTSSTAGNGLFRNDSDTHPENAQGKAGGQSQRTNSLHGFLLNRRGRIKGCTILGSCSMTRIVRYRK